MQIANRHVLVTGASRGIGAAIAREFARNGAQVTVVARQSGPLEAIANEIGGRALVTDLLDGAQVQGLVARAEELGGPVDVLVNNAGIDITKSILDTNETEMNDVLILNLQVPLQLARLVLPGMVARGTGHIVNISSMAANGGFAGMSVYSASKAGLSHFTRIVRQDLKGTGVRLTNLEVGPVPTDLFANLTYPPAVKSFARFRRIQLMPNVSAERVGTSTVRAVQRGSRAVWLPRRASLFGALTGAPQRIAEQFLRGIRS
ncbi:MAG: SDR family NAD(P)-dependent oxidoreductase [Ilumatobacteraceae bacterium]